MALRANEIFYMLLGLATIVVTLWLNRRLYRSTRGSGLEWFYYLVALAALVIGWYFNLQYMREYAAVGGWWHWTTLLFVNPASASGGQDLIFANLVLFPLWTIIDGRRRGMAAPWMYFVMSLVTSYAFAFAVFLAVQERQIRQATAA